MQALLRVGVRKRLGIAGWIAACSLFAISSPAQRPVARITTVVDDADRTTIYGTHPVMARTEDDAGRVPLGSKFEGINIAFSRTPAQEADLQALLAAQQDPTSPLYAKWLTPDEFGARFGLADSDIAKVQSWLGQHGFTEFSVSRSKNRISFSGTVEQVEAAFGTEMHYYKVNGETHFAPSRDVSVPAALSSVVQTVTNLSSFRPKSHISGRGPRRVVSPDFTSSQSGNHFLTPKDVATIYDINPAYKAGYNGAGQSIAVVGQSAIVLSDIEHFQTAAGFAVKDPTLVLVPNTGTATIRSGDEAESDLDLEYTSTIANGATIYFVYVGNNANSGVFDSIQFAVTNKTAPIISVSYGLCEAALGSSGYSSLNAILAQAASQGQSVIVASGDSGSTDCYGETGLTTAQQQALAVDFPGSSQYVTAIGGTEFPAADVASTNTTYWQAASGSDLVSSALSYIPEQVWNDDSTARLSSSGGGVSTFTPKPSWQTGVPGIPSGTFRLVPDISLSSSPNNAGYLFCSSDSSNGVTGSCTNGFRDSSNVNLTVAGGTSFAAPVFAGMLALINDKLNSTGQGVINSTLYTLAANSATYASAFHDITSGGNQCTAGTKICSTAGASQYPATSGYDQASGLGSVDLFNLMTAWPGSSSSLVPSKTTLSAATMTPAPGASDAVTITVASGSTSNTATPTGTLTVTVDGTLQTSSLALVSGSATYTFSSTTPGAHVIAATYSGDSTYASSTGSLTVTVPAPVASKTTLSAATSTPAPGASDAISITVTSASTSSTTTPTGTVTIAVDGTTQTPTLTLANGSATYTFSSTAAGAHTIAATYSGDSNYASSGGSLTLTVAAKSFKLAASNVTVTAGNPGASTITITPQNGYAGTVAWIVASSPALTNGCFSIANTTVSGTTAVAATLTVNTVASACAAPALVGAGVDPRNTPGRAPHPYGKDPTVSVALQANQAGMTMVGLLFLGLLGRRCRRLATLATLGILATIGFAASGCAGVGSSMPPPSSPTAARGAYAVTIVGTDTTTSSITASTTLTLTID